MSFDRKYRMYRAKYDKPIEITKKIIYGLLVVAFILFVSTGGIFTWIWDIWK